MNVTYSRAPRTSWCFWCRRAVRHDDTAALLVSIDGNDEYVCGTCWEAAEPTLPVDYTEEAPDA